MSKLRLSLYVFLGFLIIFLTILAFGNVKSILYAIGMDFPTKIAVNKIYLVNLNNVDRSFIEEVSNSIKSYLNVETEIINDGLDIIDAYNSNRSQFNADKILDNLKEIKHSENERVIAIIPNDSYSEGLNFIFSSPDLKNGNIIISVYRLRFSSGKIIYFLDWDDPLLLDRTLKTLYRSLGFTMGFGNSKDRKCIMAFSNSLIELDNKGMNFCDKTKYLQRLGMLKNNPNENLQPLSYVGERVKECKSILNVDEKESCYLKLVPKLYNISMCSLAGKWEWHCKLEIAVNTKNITICNNFSESQEKESCYFHYASEVNDFKVCKQAGNQTQIDNCIWMANINRKDLSICYTIKTKNIADWCFLRAVYLPEHEKICDDVENFDDRELCYSNLASKINNSEICGKIPTETERDLCYESVGTKIKDVSLCQKIINQVVKDRCLIAQGNLN